MSELRHLVLAIWIALPLASGAAPVAVPGAPGELRGSVSRADGTPVASFTVNGVRFEGPRGAFRILVPPEGTFRIVVRADGLAPGILHVEGAEGKAVTADLVLGEGEDVVGEVLDAESGKPLPGAYVALAEASRLGSVRPERLAAVAVTGRGGFYLLRRAPRAALMLVVYRPGYLPEFVPVDTRERIAPVALRRPAAIHGVVRDFTGTPVPHVHVIAIAEDESDAAEAVADAAGRIDIRGLRPGRYVVAALTATGLPHESGLVELAAGRTAKVALQVEHDIRRMNLPDIQIGAARLPPGALAAR